MERKTYVRTNVQVTNFVSCQVVVGTHDSCSYIYIYMNLFSSLLGALFPCDVVVLCFRCSSRRFWRQRRRRFRMNCRSRPPPCFRHSKQSRSSAGTQMVRSTTVSLPRLTTRRTAASCRISRHCSSAQERHQRRVNQRSSSSGRSISRTTATRPWRD